VHPRNL